MVKRKSTKDVVKESESEVVLCSYYLCFCEGVSLELASYVKKRLEGCGLRCRLGNQGGTSISAVVEATAKILYEQVRNLPG